ncbi:MAG: HAD family hydrolase [Moraxellaceae bacterium]|nr:MAG: HAD family hydrolase [Moraxellaceae bacterium]
MTALSSHPFDLVIFDWDGTLFDSVSQIVQSLQWAAQQHQLDLSAEAAKNIIGLGLPEVMQTLFPAHAALHAQIQADYGRHYVVNSHTQRWFGGVDELLTQLEQQGVLLAVATGKNRIGLDRVLAQTHSKHRFIATRCTDEASSKPHPLMLQQLLAETGIAIERTVMVGDTTYDLQMAQSIGMSRIGVSYGAHSETMLAAYQPLAIVHSVSELAQWLVPSDALSAAETGC